MADVIAITVTLADTTPVAISVPADTEIIAITVPQEQTIVAIAIPEIADELKVIVAQEAASPPVAITLIPQGIEGAKGDPGPAGVLYFHEQVTASDLWVINHNLAHRPIVELFTVGGLDMDGSIVHIDSNQARVQFASPVAGFATLA